MHKRVIFVDFDGVLVTPRTKFQSLDELCTKELIRIMEATDAVVVISSSWRCFHPLEELKDMLGHFKIPRNKIIDKTPDLKGSWKRGDEIQQWLDKNPTEKFVVIDDDTDDLQAHIEVLVATNWEVGLTKEDADKAIAILT